MRKILAICLLLFSAVGVLYAKSPYLVSATKGDNALVLKFNQSISSADAKISTLNEKPNYRNFIDIKGIINGKAIKIVNFMNADEIVIAQNNPSTIRIVFKSKFQRTLKAKFQGNNVILILDNFVANENISKDLQVNTKTKTTQNKATKQQSKPQTNTAQSKQTQATTSSKGISKVGKTIVIDPGHGGKDPGAVSGKLQEKVAVLQISKKLGDELNKRGYKVHFTRQTDKFINLRDRTKMANDKNADLFISLHANAAPNAQKAKSMRGIETFFLSPARSERSKNAAALENKSDIEEMNFFSKQTFLNFLNREKIIASNKLGIDIHSNMLKNIKARNFSVTDGGVREAPFWVLVGALMPAVLIEIGYITHPIEGELMFNNSYQNALAQGIANGVDDYFVKNR